MKYFHVLFLIIRKLSYLLAFSPICRNHKACLQSLDVFCSPDKPKHTAVQIKINQNVTQMEHFDQMEKYGCGFHVHRFKWYLFNSIELNTIRFYYYRMGFSIKTSV